MFKKNICFFNFFFLKGNFPSHFIVYFSYDTKKEMTTWLAAPCFSPPFGNILTSFSTTNYTLPRLVCRLGAFKHRGIACLVSE